MGKRRRKKTSEFDMVMIYKGLQELKEFCNSRECYEDDTDNESDRKEIRCPLSKICDQFSDVGPGFWGLQSVRHLADKQRREEKDTECTVTTSCRECSQNTECVHTVESLTVKEVER